MDVESRPQRYKMLSENGHNNLRPPPYRRKVPHYHHNNNRMCSCCKCMCCCCCFLFFFILILSGLVFYMYILYQPKIPSYKMEDLNITKFQVDDNFGLSTELAITAKAQNPNAWISIIYGEKSSIVVTYMDLTLCSGKLPAFKQGHWNTTVVKVALKGKSKFSSELQEELKSNQKSGRIPLDIFVKAPIVLNVASIHTMPVKVLIECNLIVNSLSPEKEIKILSSDYKVNFNI